MSRMYQSEFPVCFTPPAKAWDKRLYKDSPDYPAPDPRYYDILQQQADLSDETLAFVKNAYKDSQARQAGLDLQNKQVNDSLLQDAAIARERSQEAYDLYQQSGKQVQRQALNDAMDYDSAGNISAFRGRAAADVEQAYGDAEQANARSLARYGVMPNANRLATINASMAANKAAAKAGAMTNAETGVRDKAIALRGNASNIAASLAGQSQSMQTAALNSGQAATGNLVSAGQLANQSTGIAQSGFGTAQQGLASAASGWGNMYNSQLQGWGAQQQAEANSSAGFGSLLGMGMSLAAAGKYADGGEIGGGDNAEGHGGAIRGPGNGVSDSVKAINQDTGQPVRVSNGEYVIPADTVRRLGTQYFDKLVEKTHTPAAIQRRSRG